MNNLDCKFYFLIFAMQSTSNTNYWFQLNFTEMWMTGTQNKDLNGRELNNIRATESDIKSLNINDNIDIKVMANVLELQSL